jgi:hypothetical protein
MTATLKVTHKAIGAEVRRGTYDIVVDGQRAGSVEMKRTTRAIAQLPPIRPLTRMNRTGAYTTKQRFP